MSDVLSATNLRDRDQRVIWHPYTQHSLLPEALPLISAEGAYLTLEDGRRVIDGISSWWVNLHGHCQPEIAAAIAKQAQNLEHAIFAGFTHEPAVSLAELILAGANQEHDTFGRVFYSDNGSTAVEAALKMAFQFHWNRGNKNRTRFLALHHSYHGDTFGAMAVGEPAGFHSQFRKLLAPVDFVVAGDIQALRQLLAQRGHEYAAFIFEPLVQAAGGMRIYEAAFLEEAVSACRAAGVISIADEVFTGFQRTGSLFAIHQLNIRPDLLCLSKGISGGFLPLAATLASREIFEAFLSPEIRSAFLHGHSYTANPIACAAAIASWNILQRPEVRARLQSICRITKARVARLQELGPGSKNARALGTIGAVDLAGDRTYFSESGKSIVQAALEKGVLLRPLGNVLYTVPPYCCTDQEIHQIYDVMEELIHEL